MATKLANETTEAFIDRVNQEHQSGLTPFYQGYLDASMGKDTRTYVFEAQHKMWLEGYVEYALDADAAR